MRTLFTTLTPEATFAVMVVSLILLALLTPLVYRKIQQWRLRRMYLRQSRAYGIMDTIYGGPVARPKAFYDLEASVYGFHGTTVDVRSGVKPLERRWG